jgi:apolipoprotein N-acyltransferase
VKNRLAAFALGAFAAAGFAPLNIWPATLIAFAAFLWLLRRATRLRGALGLGWFFGLGHFMFGLNWIATAFYYQDAMPHWLGWIAVLLLSLFLAVYPAIAAGLAWRHGRGDALSFVLLFAASWTLGEYMRGTFFTGFPWNPMGVAWLPLLAVARAATVIGTYGLTALFLLASGALFLFAQRRWRSGVALAALPLLAAATGLVAPASPVGKGALVRIVQPNIGQQEKWSPAFDARNFERLASLSGEPGAAPRLLLWPEAAVSDYLEDDPVARARLARLLGPRDLLMTGGTKVEWNADGRPIGARNSLFVLDAAGRILARYDKAHLVPYGEYLPMRPLLSAIGLSRLAPGDLDFWPGPGPRTLMLPGFGKAAIQICYEIIFSGHVVDEARRPDFLFNPSNDAWFGPSGPPQHLAQARLRAIEEGLPIVRATPTGISAVIDADGRLLATLPLHAAGVIDRTLPAPHPATPFARHGNVLPFLFVALLVVVAIARRRPAR